MTLHDKAHRTDGILDHLDGFVVAGIAQINAAHLQQPITGLKEAAAQRRTVREDLLDENARQRRLEGVVLAADDADTETLVLGPHQLYRNLLAPVSPESGGRVDRRDGNQRVTAPH